MIDHGVGVGVLPAADDVEPAEPTVGALGPQLDKLASQDWRRRAGEEWVS